MKNSIYQILFIIAVLLPVSVQSQTLQNQYDILYNDLVNFNQYGYRSQMGGFSTKNRQSSDLMISPNWIPFDKYAFYILGEGFFKLYDAKNDRYLYTRNGQFYLSKNHIVINKDDYQLMPAIDVSAGWGSSTKQSPAPNVILQLNDYLLFNFEYEDQKPGKSLTFKMQLYKPAKDSTIVQNGIYYSFSKSEPVEGIDAYHLIQGYLERSNVNTLNTIFGMYGLLLEMKRQSIPFPCIDEKLFILKNLIYGVNEVPYFFNINIDLVAHEVPPEMKRKDQEIIKKALPFLSRDYQ